MKKLYRTFFTLLVIFVCVGCDQATKTIATHGLPREGPIRILGELITLQYTENSGALLGIGSNLPTIVRFWIFVLFGGIALTAILAFTISGRNLRRSDVFGLSLLLGGGLSNLIDRLLKGGVVIDFMKLSLGPIETAIFNVADVMILAGIAVFLISKIPIFSHPLQPPGDG